MPRARGKKKALDPIDFAAEYTRLNAALSAVFANHAQVSATPNEFRLLFSEVMEHTKERTLIRHVSRVYLSPRLAKVLAATLVEGVKNHEKHFGVISLGDPSSEKERPA